MKDRQIQKKYKNLTNVRGRRILHRMQNHWLHQQLIFTAKNSPFYREKFAEYGLDPKAIKGVTDLPKLGFFTYPADLLADPYRFLAVPRQKILYAMSSSGTTGKSKIIFITKEDWRIATRTVGNGLSMLGVTETDVVQILFNYGSSAWMTGPLLQNGLEQIGAFILTTGNSDTLKQIDCMQQFGTTVLLGTPSYLHRLTEEARSRVDLRSLGIRLIRLGAEPWSESMREYLQDAWGAEVYDSYGMIELGIGGAVECKACSGLHLSPFLITEVVDPRSGEPVAPGQLGELVYTPLRREGSPLIRYRSGDLGRFYPDEICPCGEIPTDRISRILGRSDDMLFLGSGENAFPAQFESAFVGIDGVSGFQIIIEKKGYLDQLTIRVETHTPTEALKMLIQQRLADSLPFLEYEINQRQVIAPLIFEFLSPGRLHQEFPVKIRQLVDRRNQGVS